MFLKFLILKKKILSINTWWDNFVATVKNPRPFSIILAVLAVLILFALISAIISLLSYFVCGCSRCCGSRRYMAVNH
jgi:uncharacterized membrane protein YbhN (UPF0104 family)